MVSELGRNQMAALSAAPFTYAAVGATPAPQRGYYNFTRSRTLETRDFTMAVERLFTWRMHELAGLEVGVSAARAAEDVVVAMRLGVGPLALNIPCRVVYVVDELDKAGFAYGTLPGHPESGEELFLLKREPDRAIVFTITAFSTPASALARVAGPISKAVQRATTDRYLKAVDLS